MRFIHCITNFLAKTRMQLGWCLLVIIALAGIIAWLAPAQLPVIAYKLLLAPLGGILPLLLWYAVFPPANPSRWLEQDWTNDPDADLDGKADFSVAKGSEGIFSVCVICAAVIFVGGMLAVAWGL